VKRRLLIRGLIGFLLGIAMMLLIPALFNRGPDGTVHYCSGELIARVGGSPAAAMAASLLLYGLYGACCMGGTLLYDIDSMPLTLATAAHYAVIALGYALAARLLCWDLSPRQLLLIETLMTVGFFLIWLFMYLRYKDKVRELNQLTEQGKGRRQGQTGPDASGENKDLSEKGE
jgi:hypothetical protein